MLIMLDHTPSKQVPNGRRTMPQQHPRVGLHRLATLRLRWTPNNEGRHVVNACPLTCSDGGISELHLAQDAAFNWLLRQNLRSWNANDNNNSNSNNNNTPSQRWSAPIRYNFTIFLSCLVFMFWWRVIYENKILFNCSRCILFAFPYSLSQFYKLDMYRPQAGISWLNCLYVYFALLPCCIAVGETLLSVLTDLGPAIHWGTELSVSNSVPYTEL